MKIIANSTGIASVGAIMVGAFRHALGGAVPAWLLASALIAGGISLWTAILRRDGERWRLPGWIARKAVFFLMMLPMVILFFWMTLGQGPVGLFLALLGVSCASTGANHLLKLWRAQGGRFAAWVLNV